MAGGVEGAVGDGLTVEELGPAVPGVLLDADEVVGVVEDVAGAAHVGAVEGGPELPAAIEADAEGVAQPPCDELEAAAVAVEADDRAAALDVALDDLTRLAGLAEGLVGAGAHSGAAALERVVGLEVFAD